MAVVTNFTERDKRAKDAKQYISSMLTQNDLKGYWLHDADRDCGIAVFTSPSMTNFFKDVGYSANAAVVMAEELERRHADGSYTMFGKALFDYARKLGTVQNAPVRVDVASNVAVMLPPDPCDLPILEPGSDGACLQECGLRLVREGQPADLYVLDVGSRPRDYSDVKTSPRLTLATRI